jgi:hypothetical protein
MREREDVFLSTKEAILKEKGIVNPYSHKSCTPRKSRARAAKERSWAYHIYLRVHCRLRGA